jgi:hypothetical protein
VHQHVPDLVRYRVSDPLLPTPFRDLRGVGITEEQPYLGPGSGALGELGDEPRVLFRQEQSRVDQNVHVLGGVPEQSHPQLGRGVGAVREELDHHARPPAKTVRIRTRGALACSPR